MVYVGWGHLKLWRAYRLSSGLKKNQFRYVFFAYVIGYFGGSQAFLPIFGLHMMPFANVMVAVCMWILLYSILNHRLMDITIIIRKTLIYSTVMGTLAITYLLTITIFARVFEGLTGSMTVFSSSVAAGLITLCFQPLRKRVQAFVDGKFFRQYVDREEKLYELSREVITHTTPEAMGQALIHVLEETLHPKGGALYLRSKDGSGFSRVSSIGTFDLPERMDEENELARYFKDHPQPFIREVSDEVAESRSTRLKEGREAAA